MNDCTFTGRLTKDPKGYGSGGKEVKEEDNLKFTSFNIVVNSGYGEYKTSMVIGCKIDNFYIACWALKKLYKGVEVIVNGSLYENSYFSKASGATVSRPGLRVKDCQITRHTKEYLAYKNMGDAEENGSFTEKVNVHMHDTYGNDVDSEGFMIVNPNDCDLPFE